MKKAKRINTIQASIAIIWSLCISVPSIGQDTDDLFDLSLEELMNVEIVSASKANESLFDAPVSSYSITRKEILQAGITSIPEALRLVPGMIVRETTNGNYDAHVRGFEAANTFDTQPSRVNRTTLVMINNRPVFNYILGGTYWDTLPIGIDDIDKIEVVRGPSAALYGPNAVTGIINIITNKPVDEGVFANGSVQSGSNHPILASAYVGIKPDDKFDVAVSVNYQERDRHESKYYNFGPDEFVDRPEDLVLPAEVAPGVIVDLPLTNANAKHPNPTLSVNKYGVNTFLNYKVNDNISLGLESGLQRSDANRIYMFDSFTPLTETASESEYVNITSELYGAKMTFSYLTGSDNFGKGSDGVSSWDYQVSNFDLEYNWKVSDQLMLRPGFSYQSSTYDDTPYTVDKGLFGYFNSRRNIATTSGSFRADYNITDQWRFIAAVRADKFSVPDEIYASYQIASTFKFNDSNLLRAVVSRSNSGSYIVPTFIDIAAPLSPTTTMQIAGNDQLKLFYAQMFELGYRLKIGNNLQFDFDLFTQYGTDLPTILIGSVAPVGNGGLLISAGFQNLDLAIRQNGATLAVNYIPNAKWQLKPFVTIQKTNLIDLPINYIDPGTNPFEALAVDITITNDIEHENTPTVYGGFFVNYKPLSKLNVNLNSYFYSEHTQFHSFDQVRPSTIGNMAGKFLLNAKVSYEFVNGLKAFVNVRNLTNDDSREYYGTDRISSSYLGGVSFNF